MSVCLECHSPLEAGDAFCVNCGAAAVHARADDGPAPLPPDEAGSPGDGQARIPPDVRRPVARPSASRDTVEREQPAVPDVLRDSQILASDEPNSAYLGQRLQYQSRAETFDISEAVFAGASLRASGMMALLFFAVPGLPVWFVVYRVFGSGVAGLYAIALFAACVFIWLSPLFRRHYFPVSEWKLSLDGKGATAAQVFDHIADAVVRRAAPLQYRIITLPDGQRYLNLRLASYDAYITCMAFGHDLYIGWTLWASGTWREMRQRERSFFLTLIGLPYWLWLDLKASRSGASFDVALVHQFDVVKAMRECLHAVTREGVEAAVGTVPLRGAGTIGSKIPSGPSPAFAGTAMSLR